MKVELNKKSDNPFYGLKNCINLYNLIGKGAITETLLNSCFEEVKDSKEKREMFFSLLFSIGDITAREHNIFRGRIERVDNGGSSQREDFMLIVNWLRNNHYAQFRKFLYSHLFHEYVSFDTLLANRIQTVKGKSKNIKVKKIYSSLSLPKQQAEDLADYCARIIKGSNPAHKYFLAKFLTRPRSGKRKGHKRMLPDTKSIMNAKKGFMILLSEKLGFEVVFKENFIVFKGYNEWRQEYIGNLESVLFASKKILEFDKQEFLKWLNTLPSTARFRVRTRLLSKENKLKGKWVNLGEWFLEWEKFKENKQTEQRVIEEKVRQGVATEKEVAKLEQVKKEAKVTVGAVNFKDLYCEIVKGTVDKLKIQPFLDKINLNYNTLTFIDDSGSMAQFNCKYGFNAFDFANFIATITLMKNPSDEGRSLIGYFSREARLYTTMDKQANHINSILNSEVVHKVGEPIIKPEEHFLTNLARLRNFSYAMRTSNGTNISSIPEDLRRWVGLDTERIEQLQQFPVWTIISDGNWNTLPSPEASINDFMRKCQLYFGFKPFIIAIDVSDRDFPVERFSGIENFMYMNPNPAQIEQFLVNFKDLDVMDIYTPLLSIARSNRYLPVRENTL